MIASAYSAGAVAVFVTSALLVLVGAIGVISVKNPVHAAMSLIMTLFGVAVAFVAQSADFLAAVQVIVYAGAIVVLFLFVIMLLGPAASTPNDRRGLFARAFGGGLAALGGAAAIALVASAGLAAKHPFPLADVDPSFGGVDAFGSALFADALVPFEVSGALLMVAVVGALAVARGRQGVASLTRSEREVARAATPEPDTAGGAGVYSHEIHAHEEHSS